MKGLSLIISFGNLFYAPVVFMLMWGWFVANTFNISELGYWQSFGLLLFLTFFKNVKMSEEKSEEKELTENLFMLIYLTMLLGISFVIQLFAG